MREMVVKERGKGEGKESGSNDGASRTKCHGITSLEICAVGDSVLSHHVERVVFMSIWLLGYQRSGLWLAFVFASLKPVPWKIFGLIFNIIHLNNLSFQYEIDVPSMEQWKKGKSEIEIMTIRKMAYENVMKIGKSESSTSPISFVC